MGVEKFRSITEVGSPWREPLDPQNIRRAIEWSGACLRMSGRIEPRGVRKFASTDEAWRVRQAWALGR